MTNHVKDMSDQVFNSIHVLNFFETRGKSKHAYWMCQCICGKKFTVRGSHLRDGSTKSCGCQDIERARKWLTFYATSDRHKGSGNPMWKGGISTQNELDRKLTKYKVWREKVFKRDKYKCKKCGNGGYLHAHHIKHFSKYPKLRFTVSNGITLCLKHHKEIHETRS